MSEGQRTRKHPLAACEDCPLRTHAGVTGRPVLGATKERADVVIVGESPGYHEMLEHAVFVGPTGQMLAALLKKFPLQRVWLTNAALCFSEDAGEKAKAARCCRERLVQEVAALRPQLVITLGNIPTDMLLGKGVKITERRGTVSELELLGHRALALPTFHPAYILRDSNHLPDIERDFARAADLLAGADAPISTDPGPEAYSVTEDWASVLREARRSQIAVLDIETSGLDITRDEIICAVVATDWNIYVLPRSVVDNVGYWREAARGVCWSGHNAKFDQKFILARTGINVNFQFDSMLAHYVLEEHKGTHGLKGLARALWNAPDWEAPLHDTLQQQHKTSYADVPPDVLYRYAAFDGYYQRKLTHHLRSELAAQPGQRRVLESLLMPAMHALCAAELKGVQVDLDSLRAAEAEYTALCAALTSDLCHIAGHALNPRSTQQVAKVMFDELRLQPFDGRSTAENTVLLKYTHPHPFVTKLLAFREANTLLTRYLAGLPKYIGADGRIHTTFNLHGTVTGRLSSSDPNMQNTPRDNKTVKRLFIPDPGNAWIDVDYSQIELRVIALLSKDPWLMQCYAEGRDLHSEMAEYQYGKAYTKEQRNLAKRANFLLAYGGSVGKLATSLTISPREAASMHERFFERMSGILPWIEEIKALVSKNHVIETPLGRVRHFPEIAYARSQMDRETIYREAVNNNPQSVASDVTLNALIKLHQAGYDVRLTVHDSISVQAPVADARGVAREVMRIMEGSAAELLGDALPFTAEAEIGDSWGTLQEV